MDVSAGAEFEKLIELMARLRGPDGCPWDREQTMASLRPFVLEEAYELVDAIGQDNTEAVCEELGDLLLEVVFVAQVGIEAGAFTMPEIVRGIREKLIRRHPHVFESKTADGAGEALAHWEDIKAKEKPPRKSHLDGVPRSLPALSRAAKISKRAAHAGFDWDSREQVLEKIDEEVLELKEAVRAGDESSVHEELGDLLFAIVNFARLSKTDGEVALLDANEKFSKRFRFMEKRLAADGKSIESTAMVELERLWAEAKN